MKIIPFPFHLHRQEKKQRQNSDHHEEENNGRATFLIKHKNNHGDGDEYYLEDNNKPSRHFSTCDHHGSGVRSRAKMTHPPQSPSSLRTTRRHLRKRFLDTLDDMVDEQLHDDPALLQALSIQNMMDINQL